jgi:hypothetical protein
VRLVQARIVFDGFLECGNRAVEPPLRRKCHPQVVVRLSQLRIGLHGFEILAQRPFPILLIRQRIADVQIDDRPFAIINLSAFFTFDVCSDQSGFEMLDRIGVVSAQVGADTLTERRAQARSSHESLAPAERVQIERHEIERFCRTHRLPVPFTSRRVHVAPDRRFFYFTTNPFVIERRLDYILVAH